MVRISTLRRIHTFYSNSRGRCIDLVSLSFLLPHCADVLQHLVCGRLSGRTSQPSHHSSSSSGILSVLALPFPLSNRPALFQSSTAHSLLSMVKASDDPLSARTVHYQSRTPCSHEPPPLVRRLCEPTVSEFMPSDCRLRTAHQCAPGTRRTRTQM